MEGIWLQAGSEAVAQAEAEAVGEGVNQPEILVVAQVQWQCLCLAVVLLVIPQIVQAALVQMSELSSAHHTLTLVIPRTHSPALLEWDFGCREQKHHDKKPGKRSQGQSYPLSQRERAPCGGSQWRTSG